MARSGVGHDAGSTPAVIGIGEHYGLSLSHQFTVLERGMWYVIMPCWGRRVDRRDSEPLPIKFPTDRPDAAIGVRTNRIQLLR